MAFTSIAVLECHIPETEAGGNVRRNFYFLADSVNQMKVAFGIHHRERDSWETSSGAEVENFCARFEFAEKSGDGQGMKNMPRENITDVGT